MSAVKVFQDAVEASGGTQGALFAAVMEPACRAILNGKLPVNLDAQRERTAHLPTTAKQGRDRVQLDAKTMAVVKAAAKSQGMSPTEFIDMVAFTVAMRILGQDARAPHSYDDLDPLSEDRPSGDVVKLDLEQ